MDGIAPVLRGYVEKAFEPIGARMLALEQRFKDLPAPRDPDPVVILRLVEETVAKLPPALPGKNADPALVAELVDKAVAALDVKGEPGTSVSVEDVSPLIEEVVQRHVALLPKPEPGKSVTVDDVQPMLKEMVDAIERPKDGNRVTVDDLAPLIAEQVAKAVSEIQMPSIDWSEVDKMVGDRVERAVGELPEPKPGKDADPEQVASLVTQEVERAVAGIPAAKDGVGLAGALIDRDGCLVVTLTDGTTKTLGAVVGKDADTDAIAEMVRGEVAKIPIPKDGLGFEDMTVETDGDRGCVLRFERGDLKKEFTLSFPMVLDRGVWREQGYAKGDGTTYGGSFFIAQRATEAHEKPGNSDGWRLAIKKGRDGRDGAPGKPGERGPKGEAPARNFV